MVTDKLLEIKIYFLSHFLKESIFVYFTFYKNKNFEFMFRIEDIKIQLYLAIPPLYALPTSFIDTNHSFSLT